MKCKFYQRLKLIAIETNINKYKLALFMDVHKDDSYSLVTRSMTLSVKFSISSLHLPKLGINCESE